jgi:hypothetical protein
MPYKNPEIRRQYMREYMRAYRRKSRKPDPESVIPPVDLEHLRGLSQARGQAVSTPEGRGTLLQVEGKYAVVVINAKSIRYPSATVGLWG